MEDSAPLWADQRRALSFGAQAQRYDRVRPDYPPQALAFLLADLPGRDGRHRVADVGAGTGKLTALLAAGGLDVDAIEPDPGMRAVLATRVPGVRVHAGRGEALPLPDGSVDGVVYGTAWHWIDDVAGAREADRVLRPGGVLATLWNCDQDVGWMRELNQLLGYSPQDVPLPPALPPFGPPRVRRHPWRRAQDVEAIPDYVLSHSSVATLPQRRRAEVLSTVHQLMTSHPDLRGRTRVEVPMDLLYVSYHRDPQV